ncbi:CaiF/GrlA family transcriptional regulator [Citrobacter koseri]|uniref:CaiF/GrlA family transcriptional regulator n=1 Tax=Citrobacter koseri TaxID=545 RepID=UPI000E06CA8B|nr:CaiF/GrlA family transcriptional regulator [Citrobacter koseri]STB73295.1 Uncharacterised protein [Citrobacter koseri]STT23474.1 Uncharacterised protein [Citrobacter koseri]
MDDKNNISDSGCDSVPSPGVPVLDLPLYLRVALWALAQGRAVSRDEVGVKFRVSARQAGDVMLYISGPGAALVEAVRTTVRGPDGYTHAVIEVKAVHVERYTRARGGRPRGGAATKGGADTTLRDLFLWGRRAGQAGV